MNYQIKIDYCEYIRKDIEKMVNTDNVRVDVYPDRYDTMYITLIDRHNHNMAAINLDIPLLTNFSIKAGNYSFVHKLINVLTHKRYYKQEK